MLSPYVANLEKVAMGLLSFIKDFKAFPELEAEMARIKAQERSLYLYRPENEDNYIGLIGFDQDQDRKTLILRYIAIQPSYRGEGLTVTMIQELSEQVPAYNLSGSVDMACFLKKWGQTKDAKRWKAMNSEEL